MPAAIQSDTETQHATSNDEGRPRRRSLRTTHHSLGNEPVEFGQTSKPTTSKDAMAASQTQTEPDGRAAPHNRSALPIRSFVSASHLVDIFQAFGYTVLGDLHLAGVRQTDWVHLLARLERLSQRLSTTDIATYASTHVDPIRQFLFERKSAQRLAC